MKILKKFFLLGFLFLVFFSLLAFSSCKKENSLVSYVSDLRCNQYYGKSENFSLSASYGFREKPFVSDGKVGERVYALKIKLLDKVSAKVKVANPKGTKQAQRDRIIVALKESIECKTYEVLAALKGWIDSVMADPKRYLSKQQVAAFKDRLDDYCNGDLQKALEIIRLATVHAYVDCQWAINVYERNNQPARSQLQVNNTVRVTEQKKTVEVGEDAF